MTNSNFTREIQDLINKKKEGEYWDFKQEHHKNNADLLHDILCMSNNLCGRNKYIICGVNNYYEIVGVEQQAGKTQADIIDFLSGCKFAGDIRPEVELHSLTINKKRVDVLTVFDKSQKPYFLTENYSKGSSTEKVKVVRAGVIYSRVGDRNTAIDKIADLYYIEKMWRQRFGLDLPVIDKFKLLLQKPEEWSHNPADKRSSESVPGISYGSDHFPLYHKFFPEFRIELSEKEDRGVGESFIYFYTNQKAYWGTAYFKYHSTIMFQLDYVCCDQGGILLPVPDTACPPHDPSFSSSDRGFYYYLLNDLKGLFLRFLRKGNLNLSSREFSPPPILIFENEKELNKFIEYVKKNRADIENIKLTELDLPNHNLEHNLFSNRNYEKYADDRIEVNAVFIRRIYKFHQSLSNSVKMKRESNNSVS